MPNVATILVGKISLDLACVDRMYLNGYVKDLQMPGGLVRFIREQRGWAIPSPVMMYRMTEEFHAAVTQFAQAQGLPIVIFAPGENKEEWAQAEVARCPTKRGVVLIGKAQEQSSAFKGRRDDQGGKVWCTYSRGSVRVTHYYFYIHDEDFGLTFIKICSYLPFEVKVCLNGHEWAKQQLRLEGIAFAPLENGFASCADPARLQTLCHQLNGARIQAFFDFWVEQLPWPLSPAERAAGYGHRLSAWQLEVSRTQVFVDPVQGRALVEEIIREHLDLGRPNRVRLIFGRAVTKRTPGEFATQVIQHGVIPTIRVHYKHSVLKQYFKDGRALRTEMMINNPSDFGFPRGLAQFEAMVALGRAINARLLHQEQVSQDCFVPLEAVRRLTVSTTEAGQRASALRFGDDRVMAVLATLTQWGHVPGGISNRALRRHVAALLDDPTYSSTRMSYDLRRLRLHGLIERVPGSHTYLLTVLGAKVSHFFTKLHTRVFRPGLAAMEPTPPVPAPLAATLTTLTMQIEHLLRDARLAPPAAA